jgi:hypothetical protein
LKSLAEPLVVDAECRVQSRTAGSGAVESFAFDK